MMKIPGFLFVEQGGEMAAMALWMAPLIALLLVIRPWLRRWIGGRGMALVWSVVILRLLIPIAWTIPQKWKAEVREVVERKEAVLGGKATEMQGASYEVAQSGAKPDRAFLWGAVWLAGMAGVIGWTLLGIVRLSRMRTGPMRNQAVLDAWVEIDEALRGSVSLRSCGELAVPALVGRAIWIPERWQLSRAQWRHVLLHELGHARRGDLWMQWAGVLATALYWWNPLVWLSARAAAADREVACDEWVRRNGETVEQYGATLVALSRKVCRVGLPGAVLMASGKRQLQQRVEAMAGGGMAALWRGGVMGGIVLFVMVAITARVESAMPTYPWIKGWDSAEFRENYRKENPSDYERFKKKGGLEAQFRLYEFKKSEVAEQLAEVLGRKITPEEKSASLFILSTEEAERVMRHRSDVGAPQLILPSQPYPRSDGKPGRSTRAKIEIIRELRYAFEFSPDGSPKAIASEVLGAALEAGWERNRDGFQIDLVGLYVEVLGFHHFKDVKHPYRPWPWKDDLWGRTEVSPPPLNEALPVIRTSKAPGSLRLSAEKVSYVLLRTTEEMVMVGPEGPPPEEGAMLFPDHPARQREYWFLVRIYPIFPDKASDTK